MSKPIFVCYSRCTTCKKAEKWLADHRIAVTVRDIKDDNPTEQELRSWHEKSGLRVPCSLMRIKFSWDSRKRNGRSG